MLIKKLLSIDLAAAFFSFHDKFSPDFTKHDLNFTPEIPL